MAEQFGQALIKQIFARHQGANVPNIMLRSVVGKTHVLRMKLVMDYTPLHIFH